MEELAPNINEPADEAHRVHVLFNNNYEDQGQRVAALLRNLLPTARMAKSDSG